MVFFWKESPLEMIPVLIDHVEKEGFVIFTIRESYRLKNEEKFRNLVDENEKIKVFEKGYIKYLKDVRCEMYLLYKKPQ